MSVAVLFIAYILQQRLCPYVTLSGSSVNLGLTASNFEARLKAFNDHTERKRARDADAATRVNKGTTADGSSMCSLRLLATAQ